MFAITYLSQYLEFLYFLFYFQGLGNILDDLVTMEMLVYSCHVDDSLTFQLLQQMADYEKLELIMKQVKLKMDNRWKADAQCTDCCKVFSVLICCRKIIQKFKMTWYFFKGSNSLFTFSASILVGQLLKGFSFRRAVLPLRDDSILDGLCHPGN